MDTTVTKTLVNNEYFKIEIIPIPEEKSERINKFFKMFDCLTEFTKQMSNKKYRTAAMKFPLGGIITYGRKNKNPIYIREIDFENKIIYSSDEPILEAALLCKLIYDNDLYAVICDHKRNKEYTKTMLGTVNELNNVIDNLEKHVKARVERMDGITLFINLRI